MAGKILRKIRNKVKNSPKLPSMIVTSVTVGMYMAQLDGKKSRWSEVTIMTNRSNHMPMFIRIERTKIAGMDVLTRLDQNSCGTMALHATMVQ
jgi:hypothetical protein